MTIQNRKIDTLHIFESSENWGVGSLIVGNIHFLQVNTSGCLHMSRTVQYIEYRYSGWFGDALVRSFRAYDSGKVEYAGVSPIASIVSIAIAGACSLALLD